MDKKYFYTGKNLKDDGTQPAKTPVAPPKPKKAPAPPAGASALRPPVPKNQGASSSRLDTRTTVKSTFLKPGSPAPAGHSGARRSVDPPEDRDASSLKQLLEELAGE